MGTYIGTYIFLHHKVTYIESCKKMGFFKKHGYIGLLIVL